MLTTVPVGEFGAALFRERINLFRHLEVQIGQSPLAVGGKAQTHLIPADVDVRVVLLLVGNFSHGIDEIDGLHEVVELEGSLDRLFVGVPFGDAFHQCFDFRLRNKSSHNP